MHGVSARPLIECGFRWFIVVPLVPQELMSGGACNSGSVQILITYVFPFWKRRRRRLQTVRGPGIFKSTTFFCGKSLSLSPVRLAISLRLGQRRSTERVSNFSHRYHRTRGFLCRHYDARLKNRFPYLEVR